MLELRLRRNNEILYGETLKLACVGYVAEPSLSTTFSRSREQEGSQRNSVASLMKMTAFLLEVYEKRVWHSILSYNV